MKSKRIYKETIIKTENLSTSTNPIYNKEEMLKEKYIQYKTEGNEYHSSRMKKYTKRDVDQIIKIQRWWKDILNRLNPYRKTEIIYFNRNKENIEDKYSLNSSSQEKMRSKYDNTTNNIKNINCNSIYSNSSFNTNINSYSNNTHKINFQKYRNSKSYSNINNTYNSNNTNIKKNLNSNMQSRGTNYYIQTLTKRTEAKSNMQNPGSLSTSPSVKDRYLVETKRVEIFRKPKCNSDNKPYSKSSRSSILSFGEISKYDVKNMMRNIWNEESFCSTVESLSCISDVNKSISNTSHNNTIILEEYEEEISKLRTLLYEKDDELNKLISNLKQNNTLYNNKTWNEINIPSPINEIHIESFKNRSQSEINIEDTEKSEKKEILRESISDNEGVLEIQEMNALAIISKKKKYKNICQHLQSISILCKKKSELSEDYTIEREREPSVIQKIEEINITSIITKQKNKYRIQELDGLQILSMKNKLKNKNKLIIQRLDKILVRSLVRKKLRHNMIQELDGLEILKQQKKINMLPQCVDDLLIPREYDMLLVRPKWHSLKVQGSGLNILALGKDVALENQEVDEFNISGLNKPELSVQSQENMTLLKNKFLEKINVLIPIPENSVIPKERFTLIGNKKINAKNILESIDNIELIGEEKIEINDTKKEIIKPILTLDIEKSESLKIPKAYEKEIKALFVEKDIDWNKVVKPIKTTKVLIKSDNSNLKNPKKIIHKKEIETIERIYKNKNWKDEIKPVKTTKLKIKGIKTQNIWGDLIIEEKDNINLFKIPKEKEELTMEGFAFNLTENCRKFREKLFMENIGFNLIGNQINKENILLPYRCEQIRIINLIKNDKEKIELKMKKENYLFIKGKDKKIEKRINWNDYNTMQRNKKINILGIKNNKIPSLIMQISNSINIKGPELPKPQIIEIQKNWNNLLRGQRSGKFCLTGKPKLIKKTKLLVANGDKFFIQKEIDDEIIYNDDYNTRKVKLESAKKEKSNKEITKEIIKEKEIIPRYQREIRAQIAKVKEISESDSSSLSELDVLEGIKKKQDSNKQLINIANGYQTQVLNGEVIYTAKNKLGINLNMPKEENKIILNKNISNSNNIKENLKQSGVRKQIIINNFSVSKTLQKNENMNGQDIINKSLINKDKNDINMSPRFPNNEDTINLNDIDKQTKKCQIIFNPKIKSMKAHYSTNSFNIPRSGNIIMNSRREYEKKLNANSGNVTERMLNEKKKNEEVITLKRSKIKNVELLRDYDSQNSF